MVRETARKSVKRRGDKLFEIYEPMNLCYIAYKGRDNKRTKDELLTQRRMKNMGIALEEVSGYVAKLEAH
jgi:hypothetical protein